MKPQACIPCAKRKVRCDREEPCSNCKRRKKEDCSYIEASPQDRIAQLEKYVRHLGGDPEKVETLPESGNGSSARPQRPLRNAQPVGRTRTESQYGEDPVLIKQNGSSVYLESPVWFSEQGKLPSWKHHDGQVRAPVLTRGAQALFHIIRDDPSMQLSQGYPPSHQQEKLWQAFYRNVNPLTNISFKLELERIRRTPVIDRSAAEHAFSFALFLLGVVSLSEAECLSEFDAKRTTLLADFQLYCENALARCNFLETSDLVVVQALVMYISAGLDRLSVKSLWALVGLVVRVVERIGLHRDGTLLNLTPYETERRRRIWWHLTELDLALGISSGSTSLSSNADWDTQIPMNIEDDDISPEDKEFPKPREGLTSKSYGLWMYWVFLEQRSFYRVDGSRIGFGWVADPTIPTHRKTALVDRLEKELNDRLRFCDPIRASDVLLQTAGRGLLSGLRRLILHVPVVAGQEDSRQELLDVSIRCLEYDVVMHSTKTLAPFHWRMRAFFPWSSLIHVLSEASAAQNGEPGTKKIWDLLLEVYSCNEDLWDLSNDQRKMHAAELIVSAWKVREKTTAVTEHLSKPRVIKDLERRILAAKKTLTDNDDIDKHTGSETTNETPISAATGSEVDGLDVSSISELNFDEIDWTFWEGLDLSPVM